MNKIISLCIISLFLTDCAHLLKRDQGSKHNKKGVNIPEVSGEYPEVSEKIFLGESYRLFAAVMM